ncbi:MAG TPA: DUF2752 domain-containing protein [Pirellulales bacterium]|nr:DUF2752 domain-containing protein [Pirellulales bacterium]
MSDVPKKSLAVPAEASGLCAARRHWQQAAVVALAVAGLAGLWAVDPAQSDVYPRCALHWLTGLHCPGCGSTRAAHSLLHGNLWDALCFNALLVIGGAVAALAVAWRSYRAGRLSWPAVSGRALLAVPLVFALARNIPCFPFDLLAPHRAAATAQETAIAARR